MRYLIYGLLFVSSNLYCQDSLKLIPVPAWKLSRLIGETISGRTCDSLQIHQANEIKALNLELDASGAAIKLSTDLNKTLQLETNELRQALTHSENESVLREKKAKRKSFKKGVTVGAVAVTVVRVGVKLLLGR